MSFEFIGKTESEIDNFVKGKKITVLKTYYYDKKSRIQNENLCIRAIKKGGVLELVFGGFLL